MLCRGHRCTACASTIRAYGVLLYSGYGTRAPRYVRGFGCNNFYAEEPEAVCNGMPINSCPACSNVWSTHLTLPGFWMILFDSPSELFRPNVHNYSTPYYLREANPIAYPMQSGHEALFENQRSGMTMEEIEIVRDMIEISSVLGQMHGPPKPDRSCTCLACGERR